MDRDAQLLAWVRGLSPATASASRIETLQELWGGYGRLHRVAMAEAAAATVVIKVIEPPPDVAGTAHRRKLRSYDVERRWYRTYAGRCDPSCRVPRLLGEATLGPRSVIALEDLDASGFARRSRCGDERAMEACLAWLAQFHATFAGEAPTGLWPVGTYWHLATRPEELQVMRHRRLREAAGALDARLGACRFPTFVHGDAKPDNFCLSSAGDAVAAVDFQYTGGGCGMKDVVYFLDCVLEGPALERQAPRLLDRYFAHLRAALAGKRPTLDAAALEAEWRALYPVAWADLYRFLSGWAPGSARPSGHVAEMIDVALRAMA